MNDEKINNQSANNKEAFLTAEEISRYFRIPLSTVYCLSKQGRIKGIKIGKHWRYAESSIKEYLSSGTDFSTIASRRAEEYIEKRDYPRINCYCECSYHIYIPYIKDVASQGVVRNISASGGLLIRIERQILMSIDINDPVKLNFNISKDENSNLNIITDARITRKTDDGFAVRFRNMSETHKEAISGFVG